LLVKLRLRPVTEPMEIAKVAIVAVLIPLAVFTANWIHRSHKGYAQTAAADFILAIVIFDLAVIVASQDFEPFLRSPVLRPVIVYWHFVAAFLSGLLWAGIVRWGEPAMARFYEMKIVYQRTSFPVGTFLTCWMGVLGLVAIHVAFFAIKQGGYDG
jgi:hypothetical protein